MSEVIIRPPLIKYFFRRLRFRSHAGSRLWMLVIFLLILFLYAAYENRVSEFLNLGTHGAFYIFLIVAAFLLPALIRTRTKINSKGIYLPQIDPTISLIPWAEITEVQHSKIDNTLRHNEPFDFEFMVASKTPKSFIAYSEQTITSRILLMDCELALFKQAVLQFAPEGNPLREYVEKNL